MNSGRIPPLVRDQTRRDLAVIRIAKEKPGIRATALPSQPLCLFDEERGRR